MTDSDSRLQATLAGEYRFNFKDLLAQGWEQGKHNMLAILAAGVFTLGFAVMLALGVMQFFGVEDPQNIPVDVQFGMDLTLTLLTAPLVTGIIMMGVNSSVGRKVRAIDLFNYMPIAAWLALGALMISVFVQIGLSLLIIPGLYVAMATSFTLTLVAEKGLRPSQAILLSARVFNRYWLDFVKFYVLFLLLFVASVFTLGIGLIWTVPLYYNTKGLLYRDMFGVEGAGDKQQRTNKDESLFNA